MPHRNIILLRAKVMACLKGRTPVVVRLQLEWWQGSAPLQVKIPTLSQETREGRGSRRYFADYNSVESRLNQTRRLET
jgi:hypothetical protein